MGEESERVRQWPVSPAFGWTEHGRMATPAWCRASGSREGCGIGWRASHDTSTTARSDGSASVDDPGRDIGAIHTAPTTRRLATASLARWAPDYLGVGVLT
jgi:hypothetical protein